MLEVFLWNGGMSIASKGAKQRQKRTPDELVMAKKKYVHVNFRVNQTSRRRSSSSGLCPDDPGVCLDDPGSSTPVWVFGCVGYPDVRERVQLIREVSG